MTETQEQRLRATVVAQAAQIVHEKEMYSKAMEALSEVLEERDQLRDALIACRGSVRMDLCAWERLELQGRELATEEANRLQALLDTIDAAAKGQR
jgi:hypothetical protein